jgi:hypothetical protein
VGGGDRSGGLGFVQELGSLEPVQRTACRGLLVFGDQQVEADLVDVFFGPLALFDEPAVDDGQLTLQLEDSAALFGVVLHDLCRQLHGAHAAPDRPLLHPLELGLLFFSGQPRPTPCA